MAYPTIRSFINDIKTRNLKGYYIEFRHDGSVKVTRWTSIIPCSVCSDDCTGCDYEDWSFCSRRCMVSWSSDQ